MNTANSFHSRNASNSGNQNVLHVFAYSPLNSLGFISQLTQGSNAPIRSSCDPIPQLAIETAGIVLRYVYPRLPLTQYQQSFPP